MMFCPKCGKEINDEAVFCTECGCTIKNIQPQSDVPTSNKIGSNGVVSIVLGIIGIVFAWVLAIIGHITSITGIVLGVKEYKRTGKVAGLVLSVIGEVCSVVSSAIGVLAALLAFM